MKSAGDMYSNSSPSNISLFERVARNSAPLQSAALRSSMTASFWPLIAFACEAAAPVYLLLTFGRFFFSSPVLFSLLSALQIVYGLALLFLNRAFLLTSRGRIGFIVVLLLSHLLTLYFTENNISLSLPKFMANVGYALALFTHKQCPRTVLYFFALQSVFFITAIARGIDPDKLFIISRNFISVLVILNIGLYYFACDQRLEEPRLWPSLLGVCFALWASGRAGIASTAMLFLGSLIGRSKTSLTLPLVFLTLAGLASITEIWTHPALLPFLSGWERFERLHTHSVRHDINADYLLCVQGSVHDLLFGVCLDDVRSIRDVGSNPHNAFIALHSMFGLSGVLIFTAAIILAVIYLLSRRALSVLLILCVSLVRCFFDIAAFHGPLDILIVYCIFYSKKPLRLAS